MRLAAWILAALAALASLARAQDPYADALGRFAAALRALREGDESAGLELESCAEELCERHGRCDPREVAAWYRALPAEARAEGLRDEARYLELWQRVRDLGVRGIAGSDWALEREDLLAALDALARDAQGKPDFVPAAQALSLLARIEVQRFESDATLDGPGRAQVARRAQAAATRALELFSRAGQSTPRLEPELLLARLALGRGDLPAARAGFEVLRTRAERVRRDDFREHAVQGQLALARLSGDVREEDRLLAELARFRAPAESWPLARDWSARLLAEDHADEALAFLERCAPAADAHAGDVQEWELLCGSARMRVGDLAGARRHFERLRADAPSELALLALATLELRDGRPEQVAQLLPESLLEQLSPPGAERAHALLGEALLALDDVPGAREQLSRAFDAAREREREVRSDATTLAVGSVIGERLGLQSVALLAEAHARAGEPLEAVAVIEEAHARSLRGGAASRVDAGAVRRWAAASELGLVTWIVGADSTLAAHVAPDGSACAVRIPVGRARLELAVRRVREATLSRDRSQRRLQALAEQLSGALFPAEIEQRLAGLRATAGPEPRLLLLAHGPTESLPFELLPAAHLGVDTALAVLPGISASEPGAALLPEALARWNLVGAPLDASGRELLPAARAELEQLATLRPGAQLAIGPDFTRAALLAACRTGLPLHLSTHLGPRCERWRAFGASGVTTSEALPLCADELGRSSTGLPLVVLSTCWSGGGERVDAEGLFGLARALLASGARNLVVTSWPVEDDAAARFGTALHRALLEGAGPARATARARRELERTGHPAADWAAFRMLGRD